MSKPTVPEVLPLVERLYARNGAGCCLHIVLDDANIEDSSVAFCVQWATERGCTECLALGELLAKMSKTQRLKLAQSH